MAKGKKQMTQTEEVESETAQEGRIITIQNALFRVRTPFGAGHVLTANQAAALNQTYAEAMRNNFAASVRKARAANGLSEKEPLSAELQALLQKELDEYADSFEFNVKTRTTDPFEREVHDLAVLTLAQTLERNGITVKEYKEAGKYEPKLAEIKALPAIREAAARILAERQRELVLTDVL